MSYDFSFRELKLKLRKENFLIISIVFVSLILLFVFYPKIRDFYESLQPLKRVLYYNLPMEFREDLRQAKKIQVYPSEEEIKKIFNSARLKRITLAILNNTNETHYIGVEAYEITFKLTSFYNINGYMVEIKGKEVSRVSEIVGNSTHPVIYIIPPVIANETSVRVENYTVYISGKSLKELDLATIKFLMIVLGINVS